MLGKILCKLGYHKDIKFCEPKENPQYAKYKYCHRCGMVGEFLWDSQGGSWCGISDKNKKFVTAWISDLNT